MSVLLKVTQLIAEKEKVIIVKGVDMMIRWYLNIVIRPEPQMICKSYHFVEVLWDPNGCPSASS